MDNTLIITIVFILFASALYFFIARAVLYHFLTKKGIKVVFGLSGIPGYLECIYFRLDQNVRSPKVDRLIFSMILSLCVVIICALSLFLIKYYQKP